MERSAPCTVVESEMALFPGTGSVPASPTVIGFFVIVVAPGAPEFTATMIVKFTEVDAAMSALAVQTIAPVPPAAGVLPHFHVAGGVAETKVVLAGGDCVRGAFGAARGGVGF